MKTIGIEATSVCTPQRTGIANYTVNLIKALSSLSGFQQEFNLNLLYKLSRRKNAIHCFEPQLYKPVWHYQKLIPLKSKYGLLHSPDSIFLNSSGSKKIVTLHDLAIFKKENALKGYTNAAFKNKNEKFLKTVSKKADAIITVSQCTKNDFLELFDFREDKIIVTHLGAAIRKVNTRAGSLRMKNKLSSQGYFLFAGMISSRKNIISLIKAYKASGLFKEYKIVLAGGIGPGFDDIIKEIKNEGLEKCVVCTGFVTDEELADLYANAKAFLFPTFYEGFGLPVIEAMQYNIPVLIGNRGAAPEIAAGHAVECDPFDIDSISEGIVKTTNFSQEKIKDAFEHAARFTWENCAGKTLEVYRNILQG